MVNVYDEDRRIIAQVEYNNNLDYWDGSNYTCGSVGRHLGVTRLKDGQYVLIHGTQWQGEQDTAEIVSEDDAIQAILHSKNDDLLVEYGLEEQAKKTLIAEE